MPRNKRHYRVQLADAISAHEVALANHGGRPGIQDQSLIESAISRPYNGYYRPIYRKAAALVHSVAGNHGFIDGNKRTALILCDLLLDRSGFVLTKSSTVPDQDDLEHLIMQLTTRFLSFDETVMWFRRCIREKP